MKAEISDHLETGYALRDRAFKVKTNAQAATWKAEELKWSARLYELVARIDPADVVRVKFIGVKDYPVSHELPDGNPLKGDSEALDCHNTRIVRVVPEYLKTLPRDRRTKHNLKEVVPQAVERYRSEHPNAKASQLYRDVAAECDCDESRVRQLVKELEL